MHRCPVGSACPRSRSHNSGYMAHNGTLVADNEGFATSYFDRAAETYGRIGTDFFSSLGRGLVDRTGIPPGSAVLDIGAGTGAVAAPAAVQAGPGGKVVAIDVSRPMLLRLVARVHDELAAPILPVEMDAGSLGLADSSLDIVLSGPVLTSLRQPEQAVGEALRVLRSGGRLGLCVVPGWWWQEDPRWDWHAEILRDLGLSFPSAPSSGPRLAEALLRGPVGEVEINEQIEALRWETDDEFWRWGWSHGWRSVMEQMTKPQLATYRAGIRAHFDAPRPIEGQIVATLATSTRC
jgi:O-methyltransferase/aklanonic acid methyltransferase